MITIKVDDKYVQDMLKELPKLASRAAEMALDYTAARIGDAVRTQMLHVFNNPTPYTLNSLNVTLTKGHNMMAKVWFKDPDRMTQHYLVPQVDGGPRKLKGFERGLGMIGGMTGEYVPGKTVTLDIYGNVSVGLIRQVLSAIGAAERTAGYSANRTARSAARNAGRQGEYFILPRGNGKMPAGVYERVQNSEGFSPKERKNLGVRAYQKGLGGAVVRARGLKAIFVKGRTGHAIQPLLPFYSIANAEYAARFAPAFKAKFDGLLGR